MELYGGILFVTEVIDSSRIGRRAQRQVKLVLFFLVFRPWPSKRGHNFDLEGNIEFVGLNGF